MWIEWFETNGFCNRGYKSSQVAATHTTLLLLLLVENSVINIISCEESSRSREMEKAGYKTFLCRVAAEELEQLLIF